MSHAPWTIRELLDWTTKRFSDDNIASSRLDAEVLLAHVLSLTRIQLYLDLDKPLIAAEQEKFRDLVRRRLQHEPVAYLTGHREFWSLDLAVTRDVLIPRPESEILLEVALERLGDDRGMAIDVGTGSGALAVALAKSRSELQVIATDISASALAVAKGNAERHHVAIRFFAGDLLAPIVAAQCGTAQLIVANLPYIATSRCDTLMPDVRLYEPRLALDGGGDGLVLIRRLIADARHVLVRGGALCLEIDPFIAQATQQLFAENGYTDIALRRDLAGLERIVSAVHSA